MTQQPFGQVPNLQQLPTEIHLNLDELQDQGSGPYHFILNGRSFTMKNAGDLDYLALLGMENELDIFELAMSPEDFEAFKSGGVSVTKAYALAKSYRAHTGDLESPGEGPGSS